MRVTRIAPIIPLALLVWLLSAASYAHAQAGNGAQKKVLVLHLMGRNDTSTLAHERIYQKVLGDGLAGQIDYYSEYIDLARFGGEDYQNAIRDFLKQRYKGISFDLIIATTFDLRNFLAREGAAIFPNTPVVFAASSDVEDGSAVPAGSTGIVYETNLRDTLDIIRRLQPAVRRVFVVTGASEAVDKWHEARARHQLADYSHELEIVFWSGLTIEDLRRRISNLTPDSVVYFVMMVEDGAGRRFALTDALDQIAAVSSVPIYTWHDGYLGHGVVGGKLASSENVARHTAQLALRILRGEDVRTIPVNRTDTGRLAFDWRELQRWNLPEDRLPEHAEILHKQASFWQRNSGRIIGVIAVLAVQSALITALLIERQRRRKANIGLQQSEERYRNVVETQTELICRFLPDTTLTFVNDAYCKYFARTAHELLGSKFVLLIPESDRDSMLRYIESLIHQPRTTTHEHEVLRPDGSCGWQQWTNSVIASNTGEKVELQGVGRDISERKQLEQQLIARERDLRRLTARLLSLQDEERRRIARELHDGATQNILAITLNLRRLRKVNAKTIEEIGELLDDTQQLATQSLNELRTLSYLLHPPMLDHLGLVRAILWFVRGFSERTGIRVDAAGVEEIGRLNSDVETALFRIVQESLTNVRRHSGSHTARVRLERRGAEIQLQVSDDGHGMPERAAKAAELGVGISGMRERLIQLGGRVEIQSTDHGTTVTAVVPTSEAQVMSHHSA